MSLYDRFVGEGSATAAASAEAGGGQSEGTSKAAPAALYDSLPPPVASRGAAAAPPGGAAPPASKPRVRRRRLPEAGERQFAAYFRAAEADDVRGLVELEGQYRGLGGATADAYGWTALQCAEVAGSAAAAAYLRRDAASLSPQDLDRSVSPPAVAEEQGGGCAASGGAGPASRVCQVCGGTVQPGGEKEHAASIAHRFALDLPVEGRPYELARSNKGASLRRARLVRPAHPLVLPQATRCS